MSETKKRKRFPFETYFSAWKAGKGFSEVEKSSGLKAFQQTAEKYVRAIVNLHTLFRDEKGTEKSGAEFAGMFQFPVNGTAKRPVGLTDSWDDFTQSVIHRTGGKFRPVKKPADSFGRLQGWPTESKSTSLDWSKLAVELNSVSEWETVTDDSDDSEDSE